MSGPVNLADVGSHVITRSKSTGEHCTLDDKEKCHNVNTSPSGPLKQSGISSGTVHIETAGVTVSETTIQSPTLADAAASESKLPPLTSKQLSGEQDLAADSDIEEAESESVQKTVLRVPKLSSILRVHNNKATYEKLLADAYSEGLFSPVASDASFAFNADPISPLKNNFVPTSVLHD
jgi:hypothetical protein